MMPPGQTPMVVLQHPADLDAGHMLLLWVSLLMLCFPARLIVAEAVTGSWLSSVGLQKVRQLSGRQAHWPLAAAM